MVGSEVDADGVTMLARLLVKSADPTKAFAYMTELFSMKTSLPDGGPRRKREYGLKRVAQIAIKLGSERLHNIGFS